MDIKAIILLALVALLPAFAQAQDTSDNDSTAVSDSTDVDVQASESSLVFPNAFSPNGDDINDVYKAKEYQNITEFHAYIFNRWGQKLYEWTDIEGGWDGTFKGRPVKQGTYFALVKARGKDGKKFTLRKDVNLLRGYTEGNTLNE